MSMHAISFSFSSDRICILKWGETALSRKEKRLHFFSLFFLSKSTVSGKSLLLISFYWRREIDFPTKVVTKRGFATWQLHRDLNDW